MTGPLALFAVAVAAVGQTPQGTPNIKEITEWARSGHANIHSESFAHWNDSGQIPPVCATCHSGAGFRSLYGFDGSQPGLPQSPVPVGGVVDCDTCHHPGLRTLTEIRLPSGVQHPVTGFEGACMTCHQGRASTASIVKSVGETAEDEVNPQLSFVNPHYSIAAASLLGGVGGLGYQYPAKTYEPRFFHARPVSSCVSCHEPHNLTVAEQTCVACHETGNAKAIRISRQSHDGSGDLRKGIHDDIVANRARLFELIVDYARERTGTPVSYDGGRHPYFFADHNRDGLADQREGSPVPYASWTPRLLKAAYNWKFVGADTGIHVHNPHYALQLLYDSAEDLSAALGRELQGMAR
jgi:formate-dependent nitrite reductase cytochrome c552 subunit